jgi:hypothetical protein
MPFRQKVMSAGAALGLVLVVAGCGGQQNPIRTVNSAAPFFDGWWDGLWAVPLFIGRITGHNYGLHTLHAGTLYSTGWVFGFLSFWFVAWMLVSGFDLSRFAFGAVLVLLIFALIYVLDW